MSDKRITVWVQRFKDRSTLVLQWIDPETGKRKSRSAETSDPGKAEAARVDLESDLNNGRYQEASRMIWERFRELFEEEYVAACRPKTRRKYGQVLDRFEQEAHPQRLRSVTERTISSFAAAMRARKALGEGGHAPGTVKVALEFLHTALAWAVDQGLLPKCPKFPTVKVPEKHPRPIPAESFERLLAKAPDAQMRAYLLCGWLAGLRLAEALRLEWEPSDEAPWIDLGRDRIILPAEFVKAAEDQWVPLDPVLREALEQLSRRGRRVFRFVASDGHEITENAVSCRVITLARRAGVKLSMHTLRKGFGCRYAGKVPAQVLQKLMRHSNIAMTMRYYANVDEAVEAAVLGEQRNSKRNKAAAGPAAGCKGADANPNGENGNGQDATSWPPASGSRP
jgi:integrase